MGSLINKGFSATSYDEDKDSYYAEKRFGDTLLVIRISNHSTYLSTWIKHYPKSKNLNKKQKRKISSISSKLLPNKVFYSFIIRGKEDKPEEKETNRPTKPIVHVSECKFDMMAFQTKEDTVDLCNDIANVTPTSPFNSRFGKCYDVTNEVQDNETPVLEGLYRQYEWMYKLGCISKDLFESMIRN